MRIAVLDATVIASASLAAFLPQAFIDPDAHHDGLQVAAAMSIAEGQLPHIGAFAQYGPLTPLAQGVWMALVGETLLSIRVLSVLSLLASSLLLWWTLKASCVPRVVGIGIPLLWICLFPPMLVPDYSLLPWPSDYFLLLSLCAIALVVLAENFGDRWLQLLTLGAAGFLLGAGVFARLQVVVVIAGLLVCVSILETYRKRWQQVRRAAAVLVGAFSAVSVGTIGLITTGAWRPFLDQAILGPLQFYSGLMEWKALVYWGVACAVILVAGAIAALVWTRTTTGSGTRRCVLLTCSAGYLLCLFVPVFVANIVSLEGGPLQSVASLMLRVAYAPLALAILVTVVVFGLLVVTSPQSRRFHGFQVKLRSGHRQSDRSPAILDPIVVIVATGSAVQFLPLLDSYHLWWAAAPALLVAAASVWKLVDSDQGRPFGVRPGTTEFAARPSLQVAVLFVVAIFVVLGLGWKDMSQDRVRWSDDGILAGMWMKPEFRDKARWVADNVKQVDRFLNDCPDALWPVVSGRNQSASWRTVSWAWPAPSTTASYDFALICSTTEVPNSRARVKSLLAERTSNGNSMQWGRDALLGPSLQP